MIFLLIIKLNHNNKSKKNIWLNYPMSIVFESTGSPFNPPSNTLTNFLRSLISLLVNFILPSSITLSRVNNPEITCLRVRSWENDYCTICLTVG